MKERNLTAIGNAVYKACDKAGFELDRQDIRIEKTKNLDHGHFATNVAMLLAGKTDRKPHDIAKEIIANLDNSFFEKVEVAGPGFINMWVEQKFYSTECKSLIDDFDDYIHDVIGEKNKKTMVIDYSHPNIAKPMGVHHLLSTIIGDSIKRIYKKTGWNVIADNFIGDLGTQFGKLIHAIKKWGNLDEIEKDPIPNLLKLYVQFHFEADKDVELDDEARAEYKKFEEGDPESRKLWKKIIGWSLKEIQPIYDRLDVKFDFMNGESFYEDKMGAILEYGRRKGIFVDGKNGAWIVKPDDPNDVPVLIKKSDGTTLYATRDLARIKYWEDTWHPDLMVNVVDVAQEFHFRQLFFAQSKLNLTTAKNVHVSFGRMQFKDIKMSTRKGNIILLSEVLNEAEERAYKLAKEKGLSLTDEETKELARIMGVGAVKYNILSQNRTTNIVFEWDKVLSFEGNSVPYLMYTATRAKSVLKKSGFSFEDIDNFNLKLDEKAEVGTVIGLMMYPDSIRRATDEFKPNHIANYLYSLAQDFNAFYNALPILQAQSEDVKKSRLLMTACVFKVMEDGLGLLGIEVPEKM
jgi:arginyl-tRNA synthetase